MQLSLPSHPQVRLRWGVGGAKSPDALPSQLAFFQVDSFSSVPFRGNPAAVFVMSSQCVSVDACTYVFPLPVLCTLRFVGRAKSFQGVPDSWLQSVAMENNLSDTAFVQVRMWNYTWSCLSDVSMGVLNTVFLPATPTCSHPQPLSTGEWHLRWFSPGDEVRM